MNAERRQNGFRNFHTDELYKLTTQIKNMNKRIQSLNNRLSKINSWKTTGAVVGRIRNTGNYAAQKARNAGQAVAQRARNAHGAVLNKRNSFGMRLFGGLRGYANKKAANYQASLQKRRVM